MRIKTNLQKHGVSVLLGLLALAFVPAAVRAASSWSPTLLVNTEAFQTIDVGDGSTNIELRFGSNLNAKIIYDINSNRFNFTRSLYIQGNITATGGLAASGSLRADGNLTINDDAAAEDAVITFGNASANQTLQFLNTAQKFKFSKDVSVNGNLSGSSLTVDGAINIKNLTYQFPNARGAAGTFLKEDGSGNLSWSTATLGNGSGNILSLHPEYPGATYFGSGTTTVGQLNYSYDTTNKENYYRWTSSQAALHDYWIAIRVRVPDNFSSWDPMRPLSVRYRTGNASTAVNYVRVKILDTTGTAVALTGADTLANTSWTTATVTGPQSAGTWTPKGYFTVLVKMATTSAGSADAGFITLNWETTNP